MKKGGFPRETAQLRAIMYHYSVGVSNGQKVWEVPRDCAYLPVEGNYWNVVYRYHL